MPPRTQPPATVARSRRETPRTRWDHGAREDRCGPAGLSSSERQVPGRLERDSTSRGAAECMRPHRARPRGCEGPRTGRQPRHRRSPGRSRTRPSATRGCGTAGRDATRLVGHLQVIRALSWLRGANRLPGDRVERVDGSAAWWNSTTVSPRSFGCRVGNSRKRPASAPRSYQRSISASVSPRSTRRSRPVGSTVTAPPVLSRRQAVGVPILGVGGPWIQGRRWDDSARRPYGWMDHMAELP